jgi:MFS family permease
MKRQSKRVLVGLGFTFGLQALISFIASLVLFNQSSKDPSQSITFLALLALTLGAFFAGGFIIGLMSEQISFRDSTIVTLLALLLSALVLTDSTEGNSHYLVTSSISDTSGHWLITGQTFLYVALALLGSSAGNYLGWHLHVPQENQFDRIAMLIGLLGAIVGPFILFAIGGDRSEEPAPQGLPWYFLVIVILLVLVIFGLGFLMFMRDSHHSQDISIHPPKDEYATGEK